MSGRVWDAAGVGLWSNGVGELDPHVEGWLHASVPVVARWGLAAWRMKKEGQSQFLEEVLLAELEEIRRQHVRL